MSGMVLHEGVYYTPEDLEAKKARDKATAAKANAEAAAAKLAESGMADVDAVGKRLVALEATVEELTAAVAALGEQFAELQASVKDAADAAQSDESGEGEGNPHTEPGSGASEPPSEPEAVKPKATRAKKGA